MKQQERWPGKWREQQISGSRIEEFTRLLPTGWPQDIPLVRVTTCGCAPVGIEVLTGFEKPESYEGPCYAPPEEHTWRTNATKTTVALLAFLASQPHCYTSQDALVQALRPGRKTASNEEDDEGEDAALRRPENVVTQLRRLLYPPALLSLPETSQRTLRNLLIRRVMASQESGPGYILAPLPLLWLDVEVMEAYAKQATTLEQFGEPAWDTWKALTDIGFQGVFLPHEPYSDWVVWRRGRVKELLWQSVDAQWKVLDACEDRAAGDEAVLRLFGSYWQSQPSNEDAFRIFAEKLGKKERFEQAEESYRHLCHALELEGREPHERTVAIMEFVRTRKIQRTPHIQTDQRASSPSQSLGLMARDAASQKELFTFLQSDLLASSFLPKGPESPLLALWNTQQWPASPLETLERLSRALTKPAQFDDRVLLTLETMVRDCWRFRPDILGTVNPHLLQMVLGHLQQITMFLSGSLLASTRVRLCALTSELTQIAGWTLYEMRAFAEAQAYYRMAVRAAREAEHPLLEAIALVRMSRIFKYCAQEEKILPSLQYARHLLKNQRTSPVHSWLCAEEALAYAREGSVYESLKTLESVTEVFQPGHYEDDPYWVGFEANVQAGFFGSCYIALRQPEQAAFWYREALAHIHEAARINHHHRRSLLSLNLATTVLEQDALDEACQLAGEALDLLAQSRSPLVLQHLITFRRKLEPWKSQTVVEAFETAFLRIQSTFLNSEAVIL